MDIFKTNGNLLVSVADGTINSSAAPIDLAGRNTAGYGKIINESLIQIIENFAHTSPPLHSLLGQLWYDAAANKIKIKTAEGFKSLAVSYSGIEVPESPVLGETWWDTARDQLKTYTGSAWKVIGPNYEKNWSETGAIPVLIRDNLGVDHLVIKVMIGGEARMIVNQDPEFTPQTAIAGYTSIKLGINIDTRVYQFFLRGTAENSLSLGSSPASNYVRKNVDSVIEANVTITGAVSIGTTAQSYLTIAEYDDQKNLAIVNSSADSYIDFQANVAGTISSLMKVNSSGQITVQNSPTTDNSVATKGYVDDIHDSVTANIGTLENAFNVSLITNVNAITSNVSSLTTRVIGTENSITSIESELDAKADIESPTFTGTVSATNPSADSNDDTVATTSFVVNKNAGLTNYVDSEIIALEASLTSTINSGLSAKANVNSPALTGTPFATTPSTGDSSTRIATTEYVRNAIQVKNESTGAFWQGSRRFISTADPTAGTGSDGDFWFKYQ